MIIDFNIFLLATRVQEVTFDAYIYSRGGLVGNHFRVKYLIFHTYLLEIFFFKDLKNVTRIPEHILDLRYLLKWRRNRKFNENYVFNFLAKF